MFFKMSFDTDYFRAFVFNSTFLELYDIPAERIEKVRTDDTELLKLSYEWLRQAIFAEDTLKFKDGRWRSARNSRRNDAEGVREQTERPDRRYRLG